MNKIAEIENTNKLAKYRVNNGDEVRCTVEVVKNGKVAFRNIYEGNVVEVFYETPYLAFVKINGHERLIPVEKVLVGLMK